MFHLSISRLAGLSNRCESSLFVKSVHNPAPSFVISTVVFNSSWVFRSIAEQTNQSEISMTSWTFSPASTTSTVSLCFAASSSSKSFKFWAFWLFQPVIAWLKNWHWSSREGASTSFPRIKREASVSTSGALSPPTFLPSRSSSLTPGRKVYERNSVLAHPVPG